MHLRPLPMASLFLALLAVCCGAKDERQAESRVRLEGPPKAIEFNYPYRLPRDTASVVSAAQRLASRHDAELTSIVVSRGAGIRLDVACKSPSQADAFGESVQAEPEFSDWRFNPHKDFQREKATRAWIGEWGMGAEVFEDRTRSRGTVIDKRAAEWLVYELERSLRSATYLFYEISIPREPDLAEQRLGALTFWAVRPETHVLDELVRLVRRLEGTSILEVVRSDQMHEIVLAFPLGNR